MFEQKEGQSIAAIENVVNDYFEGYLNADPEQLSKAFHPTSRLYSTESGVLEKTETSDWLESLAQRRKKGDIRKAEVRIDGIDISGDAAVTKTILVFKEFSFTDYLSLLHIDGGWKIINKIYTVHKFNGDGK